MSASLRSRLLQAALFAVPLALGVSGCESMDKYNPFVEKQTPLPGARKPLFPEGVPGVEFGAAPQQPPNSNIPISPSIASDAQPGQPQSPEQGGQTAAPAQSAPPPAPAQQQPARTARSKTGDPNDAWSGTR